MMRMIQIFHRIRFTSSSSFINANNGAYVEFTEENGSETSNLVTFPYDYIITIIKITGTVPSDVANDETFVASFIVAVRYINS